MTDQNPVLVPAQGGQGEIVDLGTVAAENLALALNLDKSHVATIKQAIKDEINALATHFTLAFADVQTQYEIEVQKLKDAAAGIAPATCARCERVAAKIADLLA